MESSALFERDAIAGVNDCLEPGFGETRDLGTILAKPFCRRTFGHEPELAHPGQPKGSDLHRRHGGAGGVGKMGEHAERAGAPAADLKPLQPQAETAELGVDHSAVEPKRVVDLAANLEHDTALAQRFLQRMQGLADAVDQWAAAAEVEAVRAAAVAIAEAIVRAVGSAAAATPSGVDAAVQGEELGPGRQEDEHGMRQLVHEGLFFQNTHGRIRPMKGRQFNCRPNALRWIRQLVHKGLFFQNTHEWASPGWRVKFELRNSKYETNTNAENGIRFWGFGL
jgi:hypothetical protein